jgi:hypothetical protein
MKKIKENIKKIKTRFDYKSKYKKLKKEIEELKEENVKMEIKIDKLEHLLDKDFQVRKIEELEYANQHKWQVIHNLRAEIIKLKEK